MTNKEIDIITAHYVSTKLRYINSVSDGTDQILMCLGRLKALEEVIVDLNLSKECNARYNYFVKERDKKHD